MGRPYTRHPCGIYGPRNLVKRRARKLKQALLAQAGGEVHDTPPHLLEGYEQLFSFYTPALEAGEYTVTLGQEINSSATSESLSLPLIGEKTITQHFEVVAPRYSIPAEAIHGSFPPQGYGAPGKTLPHVVLADPHLPWARIASSSLESTSVDCKRNQVPWLALLVFEVNEIKLSAAELQGNDSLFKNTSNGTNAVVQSQTGSVTVNITDVPNIMFTKSPISNLVHEPSDDKTAEIIFVRSSLFNELFALHDTNGFPVQKDGPDVSRYKYMAHVRDINTTGMAESGVEDNGVFGIVISHRTGPLSNLTPQAVVAHLVSIEGVESDPYLRSQWPLDPSQTRYVAMTSLYSWNFLTLPEGSFDVSTTMQNLGAGVTTLGAPKGIVDAIGNSTPMSNRLQQRLKDGYSLTRYCTATGEQTAAIYRGPLTPTLVPYPLMTGDQVRLGSTWLSNSGQDLQIMDPEIGIMDITYATAWQLGKTLAVADSLFTRSLAKLRTTIYEKAMDACKEEILRGKGLYKSREETVASLTGTISNLRRLHQDFVGLHSPNGNMSDRWKRQQPGNLDLSYHSPAIQAIFHRHAYEVGRQMMLSSDGDGLERYDELNTPSSTSWMVVLSWILDKTFLYNIPAHYLITDPAYLPTESLRFFHIDRNWIDALVDGALSLANNTMGTDHVRGTIHAMIADYLYPRTPITPAPQYPLYGFIMRSSLVTQYPDLKVSVNLNTPSAGAPILRHENLDVTKGVMLCLLDQIPSENGLQSITFTQPPHQQSFIAGFSLDSEQITTSYKKIFTLKDQKPDVAPWEKHSWSRPDLPPAATTIAEAARNPLASHNEVLHSTNVFKWGLDRNPEIRTLLPFAWVSDVNNVLNHYGASQPTGSQEPLYHDEVPNAALAGVQLNNPIYQLIVGKVSGSSSSPSEFTTVTRFPISDVKASHIAPLTSSLRQTQNFPIVKRTPARNMTIRTRRSHAELSLEHPGPTVGNGFELGKGHGAPAFPPPHGRPNRGIGSGSPLLGDTTGGDSPIAGAPKYLVSIVPSDSNPSDGVVTGDDIPKDLVVRILLDPNNPGSDKYLLEYFMVVFKLAANDPKRYSTSLMNDYQGPGPFMLSNVRFNPLAQPEQDPLNGQCLALRVLPRSTTGSATIDMCKDLSFMLPVCLLPLKSGVSGIPVWISMKHKDFELVTTEDWHIISFSYN